MKSITMRGRHKKPFDGCSLILFEVDVGQMMRWHYFSIHSALCGSVQTDGWPDLNYNLVIHWEEGQLWIDGHDICMKACVHTAVKIPLQRHMPSPKSRSQWNQKMRVTIVTRKGANRLRSWKCDKNEFLPFTLFLNHFVFIPVILVT